MSSIREYEESHPYRHRHRHHGDKRWLGVIILFVGALVMLKKLHLIPFIEWRDIWPVFLIIIGFMIGLRKRFTNHLWWILMLIGTLHLIPAFTIMGTRSSALAGPLGLIVGGLVLIFQSGKKKHFRHDVEEVISDESTLNADVIFGGRKEIITSKDFKEGDVKILFGGVEINMIQADSKNQPMVLNLKVTCGSLELIVPSHWILQNEIDPTFGNVEDYRNIYTSGINTEDKKVLILRGTCSFGNVEIKSY